MADVMAAEPESDFRAEAGVDWAEGNTEDASLQTAYVQQVGNQGRESLQALVRRCEQFVSVRFRPACVRRP